MDRQILRDFLGNGISAKPLMTHGTSIEPLFELAKTGKIPTGKCYVSKDEVSFQDCGRLYFTPVTSNIKNPPRGLTDISKSESISESKSYARVSGFMHYIADKLGCKTPEAYDVIFNSFVPSDGNETKSVGEGPFREIVSELGDVGINTNVTSLISIYSNARKRKGVIIEPNESIMELPHGIDFGRCALSFECPEGLDSKYIQGISLLGNVEKKLMERFLDGKLEYNGFRTDMLKVC